MIDKSVIQQILGGLMKHPQYFSEVDKYSLTINDFSNRFERYIFTALLGLYRQGATNISPVDVSNFLEIDEAARHSFESNNGVEYLQDIIDFSNEENFPYYYAKLKKLNLLRDLKKQGFDVSDFYIDDPTDNRSIEVNSQFESLSAKEICDAVKMKLLHLESKYAKTSETEVEDAAFGMREFLMSLNDTIDIGPPLQGHIYNKIFGGAQRQALYIRSGSSGLGKTRQSVADACYLAYPVRYNSAKRQWEQQGSSEKVLFIVTEQTFTQVRKMILAYLSDISESRFKFGNFTEEEQKILDTAIGIMEKYSDNMVLVKMPNPTIELVKTVIRENCLTKDIGYVFFDYVFIGPSLLNEFRGFNLRNDKLLSYI